MSIASLLLIFSTSQNPAHARKLDQNIVDIYLKGAFVDNDRLVKFAGVPTISVFCTDKACRPTAVRLGEIIGDVVKIDTTELENSGADIEILFYPNPDARRESKSQYTTKPGEELAKQLHENCAVIQSRRGFEVTKVIVVVTADAGHRENLACILNETLRGAGITIQGRYAEYVKSYADSDEAHLEKLLRGLSLMMAIHFSGLTRAGQDRASVGDALLQGFTFGN